MVLLVRAIREHSSSHSKLPTTICVNATITNIAAAGADETSKPHVVTITKTLPKYQNTHMAEVLTTSRCSHEPAGTMMSVRRGESRFPCSFILIAGGGRGGGGGGGGAEFSQF